MLLIPGIVASAKLSAFNPSQIAGLMAWYDASDTSSISLSGSDVTQWNDLSGNNYNLTQGTAAYRPQSGTRTINSLNVLDYQDTNDSLAASTQNEWTFMHDATGCTIFYVANWDTYPGAGDGWFLVTRNAAGGPGFGGQFRAETPSRLRHRIQNTTATIVDGSSTSTYTTGTTTLWTILSDPNNATAADRSDIRKDAGASEKNNTTSGAITTNDPASPLRIGDVQAGNGDGVNGMVAEVIIYSGLLSSGDITLVQNYLIDKWGI